jgi:hypothetical protein
MPFTSYIQLLRDYAVEHQLPQPRYHPVAHPLAHRRSAMCQFNNLDSLGSGRDIFEARDSAAREMWRLLGNYSFQDYATGDDIPFIRLQAPFRPYNFVIGNNF